MPLVDVWSQPVLTELIRRRFDETANVGPENRQYYGAQIAPLVTVRGRVTKLRIAGVEAYGMGQFKAPNATPALAPKIRPTLEERIIELALLEEMDRIEPEEWLKLNSNDESVRNGERLSLIDHGSIMQTRNERLTEWMRWEAFKGTLTITYPTGSTITVDYGIPGTHKPTAATPFSDFANSDPIEVLNAWAAIGAADAGQYYNNIHWSFATQRNALRSDKMIAYLSAYGRPYMTATLDDLGALLAYGRPNFHLIDAGYRAEGATGYGMTKFLPDNKILMTTDYVVDGVRIADVADGQVLVGGGGANQTPDIRQGMQSEFITDPISKNVFLRQASARIPRVNLPENFLYGTV